MSEVSVQTPGLSVNDPDGKVIRTRSRFPSLSYHLYNTERFGEYTSNFVMDCVEGDRVPIRSGGSVRSHSLKAPLMQSIFKKKDYYLVPMEAILPINWQKFYTNPVIGGDVSDDVGTGVKDFWYHSKLFADTLLNNCFATINNPSSSPSDILNTIFRTLVTLEYFYSNGSLMHSLGCNGGAYFHIVDLTGKRPYSFDSWMDLILNSLLPTIPYFSFFVDGVRKDCILDDVNYGYYYRSLAAVPFRDFLQYLRDDLSIYVYGPHPSVTQASIAAAVADFFDSSKFSRSINDSAVNYDLRRLWAYQLTIAHYYSNDHVDYIYSADLFRSLIDYYNCHQANGTFTRSHFLLNGIHYEYDSMSAYVFMDMLSRYTTRVADCMVVTNAAGNNYEYFRNILGYFSALFAYRRSLRFVDYFTGARTRPLAVGDVNVPVDVNNQVCNVVDVSRNIQRQRFFNAVNRFGRKFEEYIKGLSGVTPAVDYHNPLYLAHTSDQVYGIEVENTGAAQVSVAQSVTSRLMTNGGRYQFEFSVDRPCVVIGISYYDIPRAYAFACERPLLHLNRFDMFNPFMQFIGDQDVKFAELGSPRNIALSITFGYQLRHMEYKQRFDQCAGGFVEDLPGYLFKDSDSARSNNGNQSADYIRSSNSELDPFYVSLTGYSLGHYFHFIVDNYNVCDASRPMAFAPSIL